MKRAKSDLKINDRVVLNLSGKDHEARVVYICGATGQVKVQCRKETYWRWPSDLVRVS